MKIYFYCGRDSIKQEQFIIHQKPDHSNLSGYHKSYPNKPSQNHGLSIIGKLPPVISQYIHELTLYNIYIYYTYYGLIVNFLNSYVRLYCSVCPLHTIQLHTLDSEKLYLLRPTHTIQFQNLELGPLYYVQPTHIIYFHNLDS